MEKQDPIISFLIEENIIDEGTVKRVLGEQQRSGQSLINILRQQGILNEEQLTRVVAATNKIEFINLSPDMVDSMVSHLLSYDMVSRHNVIPVKQEGRNLTVAMSSPLNLPVRDEIEAKTGYKVIPVAATPSAIKQAIHYHFSVQDVTKQTIVSMRLKEDTGGGLSQEADELLEKKFAKGAEKLAEVAETPITKLVSSMIDGAIDARASDIHIEPQETEMRVRYRVDGLLRDAISVPPSAQLEVISHIKISADMDISERRAPQDGHMTVRREGKEYDLRVASLPASGGEKIVIRILDKSVNKWSLDTIVTNPDDNQKMRQLAANPYGMVLLTGPTGSGKTTTLYAILRLLNTPEKNIVTVEDPVEYRIDGITQVQVRPAAGVTFASSLRSIVRQDPDIILVGEIRDYETAEIAVSAALTGHLVLSTLHTNEAAGAISRLINLGVQPFLVASALLGAVAQRLIRTSCSGCKQSYHPSGEEVTTVFGKETAKKKIKLYRGTGCNGCYQSGYRGRKSIYEILSISSEIRKMIVEGSSDEKIRRQAVKEGMRSLKKSAIDEVVNGATTTEELIRVVDVGRE